MSTELATLTAKLAAREEVIQRGLNTFIEVGRAISEIRDQKLYREAFGTFEEYCRKRWGWSDRRVRYMISAAETVDELPPGTIVPTTESQARELANLEPEIAAQVMQKAHENTDGKITAAAIKEAREQLTNPKPEPPADDNGIVEVACNICDRFFPIQETYEAIGGGFECEDCVSGVEPAPEPVSESVDDRRIYLAPAFKKKTTEVIKAVESLVKKVRDDRFGYNAPSIARDNLPELIRARQDLDAVIAELQANWKGSES